MNVLDALLTRRTIHAFRRDPVPVEIVRRAVEAAVLAPNHRLTEPWQFTLLGREAREPLAELSVHLKAERDGEDPSPEIIARIRGKILDPPLALVVTRQVSDDPLRDGEDRSAVACALQNLFLALHAEGVGSKWSSGAVIRDPRFGQTVGVETEGRMVEGIIWIGYPESVPAVKPRAPIDKVYVERLAPGEASS